MFWRTKKKDINDGGLVPLTELSEGSEAVIREIQGGENVSHRIESLGIRVGRKVTKMHSHLWRGPIMLKVDRAKIAVGRGMAGKIIVEKVHG